MFFVVIVVFSLVFANVAASNMITAAYAKKHHTDNPESESSSGKRISHFNFSFLDIKPEDLAVVVVPTPVPPAVS